MGRIGPAARPGRLRAPGPDGPPPLHLGRLRRRPDHRPVAARSRRDDDPPAAELRVPLRRRLRVGDGRHACPLRPGLRPRPRRCDGAPPGLPHLLVDVVHDRARRPRRVDRRLHARADAEAVAPVGRDPGRPAGRLLRSDAAGPGGDDGRRGGRRPGGPPRCTLPRARGGGRRRPLPLRRPPSLDEAGDAAHPPRADPVPRRRRRDVAVRRRAGPRHRRGRLADGPADRDAGPARRQELRLRGTGVRPDRAGDRLHDRPRRVPERPADRPQDDPGQRPAGGGRLHTPPEWVRAGA